MPNEPKNYDLIIIGGGPAGLVAATTATASHKKIAIIDSHHELGGAGINTGTVPSKTLRETALALSGMKSRDLYGVDLSLRREVNIRDFLGHEKHVKAVFNDSFLKRLQNERSDVYFGEASFSDPHTIQVKVLPGLLGAKAPCGDSVTLRGEKIMIATGSSPVRPPLFDFTREEIYDSDSILMLHKIPKSLAVIGAGVIGSEYASTFAALEAQVHIIDGRDKLLPFLDVEVSQALQAAMERAGITFHWKEMVQKCECANGSATLTFTSGKTLTVDAVLVAAGRKSNVEKLALPSAGVSTGDRGLITVNEHFQTNVPHIYAAGDVIGFPALASTSMEQARRAVAHALDLPNGRLSPLLPNGIYTIPEVSMIGETEESLKKKGVEYIVGRSDYKDNARGQIIGDKDGFIKLLFQKADLKLVGVHVMGELATEVAHIGLMTMLLSGGASTFVEACFNVPTLGMLYKTATLAALRQYDEQKQPVP